ncbi:Uncharacterized phage protein gp47/JayE (JayE) [Commensalibacter communis]|uniref:Uncharacterized phage protein gp47/JayE (JayE) n=1 Tax=Commensalibacter communis TaxID=2972786 RepID=A0A9W4X7V4_9PROT|nr:baseplate J/gp47 family protein [Commensalibacter communis]CAI3941446.1 Uncharacterized phage protein gp47/JayE (JayE) [Commensalibacter communis]CAI3945181.1 Uncharacterized phage protein gp47/JayE (JayE) [Commensalibacter communis]CAI3959334.1 Uncharacterized phage protein gp47/JayE (JayE) [Commensalibacter communis]CAI3960760.1 Uncharacterized phage protein gp47/JayE (JayE) [Commensalibacter communis]
MSNINIETNVPEIEWSENGITLPEEDKILDGVIQDFQNAFENKLKFYNKEGEFLLSTPQGQLVTSISAIISDRNRLLAYYVNQVDPSYAMGRMQDGIGRIYFIERKPATYTEVVGLCRGGGANVVIPQGTPVKDKAGNVYAAKQDYTIGDVGTVEATFVCNKPGAIECPANSIDMYQRIAGWDSVENPKAGVVGRNVESQAQFEQRRRQSVAGNSVNSVDSIMADLLKLTDANGSPICQDAYVTENSLGEAIINGNVTLKPHSIFVCVAALDSFDNQQAIAKSIWRKKPPGCAMNGDVTVEISDDTKDDDGQPLYSTPPTYQMTYQYAVDVSIYFNIVMTRSQDQPKNAEALIKDAVYNAFIGEDGSIRPRIGSKILSSDFLRSVLALGNWARVTSIQIARGGNFDNKVSMGINEMPSLTKDHIKVTFNG